VIRSEWPARTLRGKCKNPSDSDNLPIARNRGGTPKKATGKSVQMSLLWFHCSIVPSLAELLRWQVLSHGFGRSITEQRDQAIGQCATPAEVVVSAGKLLIVHFVALSAQHVTQRASAK
jgi:hypothetical protein